MAVTTLLLLLSLALVVACGVFVAAEFAFVTVDRATVDREVAAGDRGAAGVATALQHLSTQLSGAQLGITVTNLAIGFMAEPAVAALIDDPLQAFGLSEGAARGVSLTIALVLATAVTMVYGELVPKNLAIARPLDTARAVQRPMRAFTASTNLLIRAFNGTANRILRLLGLEPQEELASARTAQELVSLVRRSAEQGTLEEGTASLLQRSLLFGDKTAIDVRTHRTQMESVTEDEPVSHVLTLSRTTGHSRFPVLRAGVASRGEEVVGLVHVKHAVSVEPERRGTVPVRAVMVPPVQVPETLPLDDLLETLRGGGLQMAVVVDEFGGVDGVVTLEDLVEELVGDVFDEHDDAASAAVVRDGRWTLDGTLRPDEVHDRTGVRLPEHSSYETVGGLVVRELGRLAVAGDAVVVQAQVDGEDVGCRLEVLGVDGRRVAQLLLEVERTEQDVEQAPGGAAAGTGGRASEVSA